MQRVSIDQPAPMAADKNPRWLGRVPVRPCEHRGFTLTEILVAVSIMAVLAALLFTAVQKALVRSYAPVCLSNLRVLAAAHLAYKGEHQDQFISSQDDSGAIWTAVLRDQGYLEEHTKAFFCPAFDRSTDLKTPEDVAGRTGGQGSSHRGLYSHYGYNINQLGSSVRYGGSSTNSARSVQLSHPSQTLLLTDSLHAIGEASPRGTYAVTDTSSGINLPQARHNGCVNVAFADGHAEAIKLSDTNNPYAPAPNGLGRVNDPGSLWKR